jgi:hypothetical protein
VRERLGELYLTDIGVPPAPYRNLAFEVKSLFAQDSVVSCRRAGHWWVSDE